MQIMGIEKGEQVQAKGIGNTCNKTIAKNYPNLKKEMPTHTQEVSRTPKRVDQNRTSPLHILFKTIITEKQEKIVKAVIEKNIK
jgi:hypothetical protein